MVKKEHLDVLQLELQVEDSEETRYVRRIKETLAEVVVRDKRGDRVCVTFKMSRDRHGELMAQCARHKICLTDLLTLYIDSLVPKMQRAKFVEVAGYSSDDRTKPPRWRQRPQKGTT